MIKLKAIAKLNKPYNKQNLFQAEETSVHVYMIYFRNKTNIFENVLDSANNFIQFDSIYNKRMHSLDQWTPSAFDILITDISAETIKTDISQKLGHKYLAPLKQHENQVQQIRTGIYYGASNRFFMSIPTRFNQKNPIWIHYLVDIGSPSTFLTSQAIQALTGPKYEVLDKVLVYINGETIVAQQSINHFDFVNIIGTDYLMQNCRKLKCSFPAKQAEEKPCFRIEFAKKMISKKN